ncbi:hypothetical protein OAD67_01925 [bacterium]|nr:hypothetical protein [bacterium]
MWMRFSRSWASEATASASGGRGGSGSDAARDGPKKQAKRGG